jgi:hypothetical protein
MTKKEIMNRLVVLALSVCFWFAPYTQAALPEITGAPIHAVAWLFGSVLIGLSVIARRKSK